MDRKLIIDAVDTVNKCGFLPSELLSQRNELLEACKNLIKLHYPNYKHTDSSLHPADLAIKTINKINN